MQRRLISDIKRLCAIVLFTLGVCGYLQAQPASCSLKLDQLGQPPEFFSIRLGMSQDEVKKALPLAVLGRADALGLMRTSFNPHHDPRVDNQAFPDVRTISLDFLDGRLATLWIGYESTFKWPKLDEFVANFSKSLGLPADWPAKRNGRELSCDGFSVFAAPIAGGPSLRINDEAAQSVFVARREAALEAAENEVIGDTRSKSYYPSDCSARHSVPQASRIVFKTKDDAEKGGYVLSKDCH
jgi:hypothetical protein